MKTPEHKLSMGEKKGTEPRPALTAAEVQALRETLPQGERTEQGSFISMVFEGCAEVAGELATQDNIQPSEDIKERWAAKQAV